MLSTKALTKLKEESVHNCKAEEEDVRLGLQRYVLKRYRAKVKRSYHLAPEPRKHGCISASTNCGTRCQLESSFRRSSGSRVWSLILFSRRKLTTIREEEFLFPLLPGLPQSVQNKYSLESQEQWFPAFLSRGGSQQHELESSQFGAKEVAQRLRALAALAEDPQFQLQL